MSATQAVPATGDIEAAPNLTPPSGNPRFPLFDSLRAIAALSVFLGHTVTGTYSVADHRTLFGYAVQLADQGVAVFFLISGFLLYRPFLVARRDGRTMALTGYARRRLLRIVPAYWTALTIAVALGVVMGVTWGNWWIFYAFGQIYSPVNLGHGIGVAWTLCIEMTFYAVLPLLSFAGGRLGGRRFSMRGDVVMVIVLAAGSLAWRAHFSSFLDVWKVSTLPGTFTWFAFGMLLAVASVTLEGRRVSDSPAAVRLVARYPGGCWVLAVLVFIGFHEFASHVFGQGALLVEHVLFAVVAMFVLLPGVFADEAGGSARRILRGRFLAWIGLVSYAFYLYHTLVIQELNKVIGPHGPLRYPLMLVSSFAISCALAAASYYVIERPAMRLGRRRPSRSRPAAAEGR